MIHSSSIAPKSVALRVIFPIRYAYYGIHPADLRIIRNACLTALAHEATGVSGYPTSGVADQCCKTQNSPPANADFCHLAVTFKVHFLILEAKQAV